MSVPLPIQVQRPLKGGLASVMMPIPVGESDWRTGVQITPVCGLEPFVWGCASDGDKDVSSVEATVEFQATTIGVEVECGPNGPHSPIGDIARDTAARGLERTRWSRLAQVLHDGEVAGGNVGSWTTNPSLQSTATTPDGFDPDNVAGITSTLAGLLDGLCGCWQADVVVHVPVGFLPYFVRATLVEWDASRELWTMGGFDFSFDCYPNLGPPAVEIASPTPTDGSEVWMYVSSRPMAGWSSEEIVAARKVQLNEYIVEASRGAIVAFDPCCTLAAKATVCTDGCT